MFNFYESYSKIFPNYIILPESKYLYKNIERKQKLIDQLQNHEQNEGDKKKEKDNSKDKEDNRLFKTEICNSIQNHSLGGSHIDFTMNSEINKVDYNPINNTDLFKGFEDSVHGAITNRSINNILNEINQEEDFGKSINGSEKTIKSLVEGTHGMNSGTDGNQGIASNITINTGRNISSKEAELKKEELFKQKKEKSNAFIKKNDYYNNNNFKSGRIEVIEAIKNTNKQDIKPITKKILQITKNKPSNLITNVKKEKENLVLNTANTAFTSTSREILKTDFGSVERVNAQKPISKRTPVSDKKKPQEQSTKQKKPLIISHKGALSMPKLSELDPSIFQNYNITNTCPNEINTNNSNNLNTNINFYGNINTVNAGSMNLQNNVIAKNVYIINNTSNEYSPMPRKIFEMTPRKYKTNDNKKKSSDSKYEIKFQTEISKSRIDKNLSNKFIKPKKREESVKLKKSSTSKQLTDDLLAPGMNNINSLNNMNNFSSQKKLFSLNARRIESAHTLDYEKEKEIINTSSVMKSQTITKNSKLVSLIYNLLKFRAF